MLEIVTIKDINSSSLLTFVFQREIMVKFYWEFSSTVKEISVL